MQQAESWLAVPSECLSFVDNNLIPKLFQHCDFQARLALSSLNASSKWSQFKGALPDLLVQLDCLASPIGSHQCVKEAPNKVYQWYVVWYQVLL